MGFIPDQGFIPDMGFILDQGFIPDMGFILDQGFIPDKPPILDAILMEGQPLMLLPKGFMEDPHESEFPMALDMIFAMVSIMRNMTPNMSLLPAADAGMDIDKTLIRISLAHVFFMAGACFVVLLG